MKLSLSQLRKLVKEASESDDAMTQARRMLSNVSKAFNELQLDLVDEGLPEDFYVALDDLDDALRRAATAIADKKGSNLTGKSASSNGHFLGSRWVPED